MSDWEPVEVPHQLSKEELTAKFIQQAESRDRSSYFRDKIDAAKKFEVYDDAYGSIRVYYTFDYQRDRFNVLASARFDNKGGLVSARKYGEYGDSLNLYSNSLFGGYGIVMNFGDRREVDVEYTQGEIDIIYTKSEVSESFVWDPNNASRLEYPDIGEIIERGEVKRVPDSDYTATLEVENEGAEKEGRFIRLKSDDDKVSIRILVQTPQDIIEQLFPKEIFGKDPYSVKPSDDKWVQANWQTMLGGLHWEHAAPQVKNEDTELSESK